MRSCSFDKEVPFFPNKYMTGTIILAIIFRLQVQIPNFSNYLFLQVHFSQVTKLVKLQLQCRAFSVFALRLSARQPAKPDKS